MQCKRCFSNMQLSRRENYRESSLEWHECPVCGRVEFLSLPVAVDAHALSNTVFEGPVRPSMVSL